MSQSNDESSSGSETDSGADEDTETSQKDQSEQDEASSKEENSSKKKKKLSKGSLLTGRGVTTQMLIDEKILEPGKQNLSINYLGRKFFGDLQEDGKIHCHDANQAFSSPSAWAMHCKKKVNPDKKSGCGWASVRYKGRKLDEFKSKWFHKQRLARKADALSLNEDIEETKPDVSELDQAIKQSPEFPLPYPAARPSYPFNNEGQQDSSLNSTPFSEPPKLPKQGRGRGGRGRGVRRKEMPSLYPSERHHSSPVPPHFTPHEHRAVPPPEPALGDHQEKTPGKGRTKSIPLKSPSPNRASVSPTRVKSERPQSEGPQSERPPRQFANGYVPPTQNYLTFSEALKAVQSGREVMVSSNNTDTRMSSSWGGSPFEPRMSDRTMSDSSWHNSSAFSTPGMMSPAFHHQPTPYMQKPQRKRVARTRTTVKHSTLTNDSDPHTLVECAQFQSIGRIQPFSVTISTSSLLLIDFHSHLAMREVKGYLGGKWDATRQHLKVCLACPIMCKDETFEETEAAESQIRQKMLEQDLVLVGWYHSHPFCQPDPSVSDIQSQFSYQQALKEETYEPCVGVIVSPYDSYKKESMFKAFWVREPNESNKELVGLPLAINYTTTQDQVLAQDIINEMVCLVNFYRNTTDAIKFTDIWLADTSYLEKIKQSIIRKLPQDQTDGRFLDFVHKMLMAACG